MNPPNAVADFDFTITNLEYVVEVQSNKPVEVHPPKPPDNSNEYVLSLTTQGTTNYMVGDQHYTISTGDVLFFPRYFPRIRERQESGQWKHIVVLFHLQFRDESHKTSLDKLNHVFQNLDQTRVTFLFQELLQAWVGKQLGHLIRSRSRIMEILHLLIIDSLEHKTSHLRMVEMLIGLMDSNEQKFYSIEELSREIGISPSYLCLIFKKTTGVTTIQYQNRIKIGKACDLLKSGEYNITGVAERLGFKDIYYFSRLFKKIMGITPSALLKKI